MLDTLFHWIMDNIEWIFSGVGVAVIFALIGVLFKNKNGKKIKQYQKSGNNSTNIQVGGDYKK